MEFTEKGDGEHQLQAGSRHEIWKMRFGLQTNTQNTQTGQS